MATLNALKVALRQKAAEIGGGSPPSPLSDEQYRDGFDLLVHGAGRNTYQNFIVPQLSQLIDSLLCTHPELSVLEIGPGPTSVFESLKDHQRRRIGSYTAFEPNDLFAQGLKKRFLSNGPPLPRLSCPPEIHIAPYDANSMTHCGAKKFGLVLFCHSMYGMGSKRDCLLRTQHLLEDDGMIIVFHRDGSLELNGLVCHRAAAFPSGLTSIADDDSTLDKFALFIAGSSFRDGKIDEATRIEWRCLCRQMGRAAEAHENHLCYSSPEVMVALTKAMTSLGDLKRDVPFLESERPVKNRQSRTHRATAIFRPTSVLQVQSCVQWAQINKTGLTIIGGGHSDHCVVTDAVAIDMSAFNKVHILPDGLGIEAKHYSTPGPLVVAGTGCTTGDIVTKAMEAGLTVPLGSRPSVGAGLWLHGGIGHLARAHGLTCDAIVGAVVVRVDSGQVVCVGGVPREHRPVGAVEIPAEDMLWALKGAGPNFGVVISVTFKACRSLTYSMRNWVVPMSDQNEARRLLAQFDELIVKKLTPNQSSDAYLYWDSGKLHLGVALIEHCELGSVSDTSLSKSIQDVLGPEVTLKKDLNDLELFETDMYMSQMHGGHGGGKTSAFKRCVFLKDIGIGDVTKMLVRAIEKRPWDLCYLHLLHGGAAVSHVKPDETAFGCRDWDFACVITGVWPRDQDGTELAQACEEWVYTITRDLLPLSRGVYAADLGPDPRDLELAAYAFGKNRPRLARLKEVFDPYNVLSYTCPLRKVSSRPGIVIIVSGKHGVGKDHCAAEWVNMLHEHGVEACSISISSAIRREYAAATGADLKRLSEDRAYKEQHRPKLQEFFEAQQRLRPRMLEERFLEVVHEAKGVDVLFITGMRDKAPVTALADLVPDKKLLDIHITAREMVRRFRRRLGLMIEDQDNSDSCDFTAEDLHYRPSFILDNTQSGNEAVRRFGSKHLVNLHGDMCSLVDMVSLPIPNFPRPGTDFCHILNIAQERGGLHLCTSLLKSHFAGDWTKVEAVVSPEAGGLVFASPLAMEIDARLVPVREAGKLPPPTVSANKSSSYISSLGLDSSPQKTIELNIDAIPRGGSVVVVDDVLSTGKTLYAVLKLLQTAGVTLNNIKVMVVAELPVHEGRKFLRDNGFGGVGIQSLLVFGVA